MGPRSPRWARLADLPEDGKRYCRESASGASGLGGRCRRCQEVAPAFRPVQMTYAWKDRQLRFDKPARYVLRVVHWHDGVRVAVP